MVVVIIWYLDSDSPITAVEETEEFRLGQNVIIMDHVMLMHFSYTIHENRL